jgi:GNAT superfamily N-acetyltransferase
MTPPAGAGAACADAACELFLLRDGRPLALRTVRAADELLIKEFLDRLSLETRRMRFFTACCNLSAQAHRAAGADGAEHFGFVALDEQQRIVAHACYVRAGPRRAEVAVEVADDLHHLGLGTHLVARLAEVAALHGIERFFAEVLPENAEMLTVFHDGFAPTQRLVDGITEVEFPTSNWLLAPGGTVAPDRAEPDSGSHPTAR